MPHYVTIHGHFYQPPRENPWLEAIEVQDSAYPYHDWNERVTAEAYRPNATSRILGSGGKIEQIVNNYARMSFNFGPTLLSWLETHNKGVYEAIIEADRESIGRFGGHGSAIAQAYNHIILPLANRRDKVTQVLWGIEDFRKRFGREPEGMWLPETAVDTETLMVLAEAGIRFTILAPRQAGKVRLRPDLDPTELARATQAGRGTSWVDVSGERIDTRRAYQVNLPSGKSIALFFYNGGLARAVAFEGVLKDGARFAELLRAGFDQHDQQPQLSHVATDGETYGHHHQFGDMALAFALRRIESDSSVRLTNYAEFISLHPPVEEVGIVENSSWSCAHGVERWRSDCGCETGEHSGWHQAWRGPLRSAFDWLRDEFSEKYEEAAGGLLSDPWGARDRYIKVILDRNPDSVERFLIQEESGGLTLEGKSKVLMLLEMQRNLLLMYTSCGWFFEDVAGIETIQDIAYAGRALQLGKRLFDEDLQSSFTTLLEKAVGNRPYLLNGRVVFEQRVIPSIVDHLKIAADYALTGLFEEQPEDALLFQYRVSRLGGRSFEAGRARFSIGRVLVRSILTNNTEELLYAAIHFGDHNLSCGVRRWDGEEVYKNIYSDLVQTFNRADLPGVIRLLDRYFDGDIYALKSLYKDGQRRLLKRILRQTLTEAESEYREIYSDHTPLMRFLHDIQAPIPKAFRMAADFILNADLRRAVMKDDLAITRIEEMLQEAELWSVDLDLPGLRYKLTETLNRLAARFEADPTGNDNLGQLYRAVKLAEDTVLDASLWNAQNACHRVARSSVTKIRESIDEDPEARNWLWDFQKLGDMLNVIV
jgi:alpha-amylase/alpha-mannosidase (GH57 family)